MSLFSIWTTLELKLADQLADESTMRLGLTLRQQPRGLTGLKAKAVRLRDRFASMMLLITMNALSVVILVLAIIGAPPRWRIDVLWVNQHANMVRLAIIAMAVAIGASTLVLMWRRPRAIMLVIWLIAGAVAVAFFWDQLIVIHNVLQRHL